MATISLSKKQREDLLKTLKARFEHNMNRHKDVPWPNLQARLEANPDKLWSLNEMERTGGEPEVVASGGRGHLPAVGIQARHASVSANGIIRLEPFSLCTQPLSPTLMFL